MHVYGRGERSLLHHSLMPAARLLAEPAGESTAGFAVMQEETRSFETHLL